MMTGNKGQELIAFAKHGMKAELDAVLGIAVNLRYQGAIIQKGRLTAMRDGYAVGVKHFTPGDVETIYIKETQRILSVALNKMV